ncbi:trypsin 3A1-like isoform X1 [Pseudomyrmex gracilis]|uniref:trypsin 3A1-like isoform X1 n=1 Tax=Pseudomyrmex gracilis TaxID=219809 RepID=UPI000994CBCA|nr:trypsin 3A1-like isoform X1 [Pseudomyrmex gracilis]
MLLAVIVALIPCVCRIFPVRSGSAGAASNETDEEVAVRIVGGEITSIKNYPFIVSIQRRYSSHSCGGTYVAPRFVLSAAHCMVRPLLDGTWIAENPRQYYVIAGATYVYLPSWGSMQIELIDKTLPHAEFRFSDMQNDIGLFRLKRPLPKSAHIQYVTIPSQYIANLFDVYTRDCHAVGWGRHIPDSNQGSGTYLRHVRIPLVRPEDCPMPNVHREKQLCAGVQEGGRDACQGDSGGPLVCNGTQVAIVSWGMGCAVPNSPGVYSRVDFYLKWINETLVRNGASKYSALQHGDAGYLNAVLAVLISVTYYFSHCKNIR